MAEYWDVAVIGGGPGGCTAALYARRAGKRVQIWEKEAIGGQLNRTAKLENVPGFLEIGGAALAVRLEEQLKKWEIPVRGEEVVHLARTARGWEVGGRGGIVEAGTVVLAMGGSPRGLGLPEEDACVGKGVSYCAVCDGALFRGKAVAVVGGGNTAAAYVEYMASLASRVYWIHRRRAFRIPKERLEALAGRRNVRMLVPWRVVSYERDRAGYVAGLLLENPEDGRRRRVSCEAVFPAVGQEPATSFLRDVLPLSAGGYVPTGAGCRTSLHGLYAVGDVREGAVRQIVSAMADGASVFALD